MDDERARRLALNEAIARDVNAATSEISRRWHDDDEQIELLCECAHEGCTERVHLTGPEYEEVRTHTDRFLVRDEHAVEEIERRVGTAGDATVVEKIGLGRQVADETA